VSRRFKQWSTGDEEVFQLRLKTWEYLADYFDKMQGHSAIQAAVPTDDEHWQRLNSTLRDNRRQLTPNPIPFVVSPPTYRTDGTTPFGAPTTLNTSIVVNAVTAANYTANAVYQGRAVAPYQVRRPLLLPPPAPRRRSVFRSRMFCITCGWRRNQHQQQEGVAATCIRDFCGKCYYLKIHHPPGKFGKDCAYPVNPFCSIYVAQWYKVSTVI
jgi:hypothetical protein